MISAGITLRDRLVILRVAVGHGGAKKPRRERILRCPSLCRVIRCDAESGLNPMCREDAEADGPTQFDAEMLDSISISRQVNHPDIGRIQLLPLVGN